MDKATPFEVFAAAACEKAADMDLDTKVWEKSDRVRVYLTRPGKRGRKEDVGYVEFVSDEDGREFEFNANRVRSWVCSVLEAGQEAVSAQ